MSSTATWFRRLRSLPSQANARHRRMLAFLYWSPLALAGLNYFYTVKLVTGRSMQPTLNPDSSIWRDFAIFDKISVRSQRTYRRGDIVAIVSPENPDRMLVKRILATEGDMVSTLPPYPEPEVHVPKGHVWVEGDDSFHTDDSNRFGPIPAALIDSKLVCILWPLNRLGPITEPNVSQLRAASVDGRERRRIMDAIERDQWRHSRVLTRGGIP